MTKLVRSNPNEFQNCGDKYINAFVSFIDILGFKNIVNSKDDIEINRLLNVVDSFSKLPQKRRFPYNSSKYLPMVMQFSDSIIRVQQLNGNDTDISPIDIFHSELTTILLIQGNLACNGVLVRGGLTFGQVCVQKNRIFGPAFNKAYELESSLAVYPRVVVDESLLIANINNPMYNYCDIAGDARSSLSQISEYTERTDDGIYSIDYLPHLYEAIHGPRINDVDILIAHRDQLYLKLAEAKNGKLNPNIMAKVRWAISYHNRSINKHFRRLQREYEDSNNSLIVYED